MPIPKGLVIYKVSRYQYPLPVNIKYRCYSSKVVSTPTSREAQTTPEIYFDRYPKKLVTEIQFEFDEEDEDDNEDFREADALKIFSKCKNVKKCTVECPSPKSVRIFGKLLKILKRIKNIELDLYLDLIKNYKFFKSLLVVSCLEILSLYMLSFTLNLDGFQLFTHVIKQASKRRSWSHFKCLNLDFPNEINPKVPSTLQLEKILGLVKDLKSCENIHKCSNLTLVVPFATTLDSVQTRILEEIAQIAPSLTRIRISGYRRLSNILKIFESRRELQGFFITDSGGKVEQKIGISPLNQFSTLREFLVDLSYKNSTLLPLYNDFLAQVSTLGNLSSLIIQLTTKKLKGLKFDISNLSELRSLDLTFFFEAHSEKFGKSNSAWLEKIFQEIEKNKKLERLSLTIVGFHCDDFGDLLLALGRSLKKLTQLSLLSLSIVKSNSVDLEEIIDFCRSFRRWNRIQDLEIQVFEGYVIKQEDFDALVECIAKTFPLLSSLILGFTEFELTRKSCNYLYQAIHKMKYLSSLKLIISSSALNLQILQKIIEKRVFVEIEFRD